MVNLNKIYHFLRFQRGPTFSRGGGGGSNFFQGRSNCLFPIETHITCDFPGGGPYPLHPPLDPHLPIAQSVESSIADHWVVSLIPSRPHTFMEIDRKIFSTVILLLPLNQEELLVTSKSLFTK